jgi:hypothetical protein
MASSSWTVKLSGIGPFRDILRRATVNSGALAAAGLWQEGLKIMNSSQREVPVRWGILRSTGTVHAPVRRGSGVEVLLTYGGPAAPYAWVQHERLHLRHDAPTKAKYLEDPVLSAGPSFENSLHRRMAFLFESGQVVGTSWPAVDDWRGPPPSARRTTRRSPRRPR